MEKAGHRLRQIGVRGRISGDKPANLGQNLLAIEPVSVADESGGRLRKLQDRNSSARLQHTQDLAQARLVVRKVAKTKPRGHQVERSICKRQVQRIRLKE